MSEWISVKDRLPKIPGKEKDPYLGFLVYRPKCQAAIVIEYTHPAWWKDDAGTVKEITHWQPLPSPPD